MEYIDIVDENNELTGIVEERRKAHEKNLWHRHVTSWIMNTKGEILLQKRAACKPKNPNKWAKTGGHVDSGESEIDAIQREIKEELGIDVPKEQAKIVSIYKSTNPDNKFFGYNFIFVIDYKIEDFVLQKEEVSEVKFFSIEQLEEIKRQNDPNYNFTAWGDEQFKSEMELLKNKRKEIRFKNMREYSHEEFVELVRNMSETELLELSANYGGYPVLFRMALDERINHIPFIQTGAAVIIRNEAGQILLQKRTDRNKWCLPGGCQELGEDLKMTAIREAYEETGIKIELQDLILIDTLSGMSRKNSYPNGDIVYNNTSLYLYDIRNELSSEFKCDSETQELRFFDIDNIPENIMDYDLIEAYLNYISK